MSVGDVLSIIGLVIAVLGSVVTFIVSGKLNEQKTQMLEAAMAALKAEIDKKVVELAAAIDKVESKAHENNKELRESIEEFKQLVAPMSVTIGVMSADISHIKQRLDRRHE